MNPVFFILIILGAIALWFLLSFVFFPLGIWKDAVDEINKNDKKTQRRKVK